MQVSAVSKSEHALARRFSWWGVALALALTLLFTQTVGFAQNASGSITGTVVDRTGAVVPNAKVVLKNQETNATRETVTTGAGVFNFPAVQPGNYKVTFSSAGLQTVENPNVTMTQGAAVGLGSVTLDIAKTTQEIEIVSANEALVVTDSPATSQTLNKNMIENLSIVGRDAAELMKIMPGMGMNGGLNNSMWSSYTTASNTGPIGSFSANGTQPYGAITMTSDGANLLDPGNQGTQTANVNQNQVAEVSILTSAYGAEFAKGPVTFQAYGKSGSAQFHGQAYLYARNGVFNSVDSYSKNQGGTPITDSFYYPGGDLGGPVIIPGTKFNRNRDKLFFYGAYEYMKQQPAGSLLSYFVPSTEMLNGNFSPEYIKSLGPGFANSHSTGAVMPCGNNQGGCSTLSFPNGIIPRTQLDPNSLIYANTFPKPNTNPATNSSGSNYQFFNGPPQNRWESRIRLDYNISEKTKLYASWNHQSENDLSPISVWWWVGGSSLPYPSSQAATQLSNVYSANLVHVFNPTLTNEIVFSKAKFTNPIMLGNPDAVDPGKLGFKMKGLFNNTFTPQIPNIFGWNNATVGYFAPTYGEPWSVAGKNAFGKMSDTPNIGDNITWVKGRHTLKAGFYWDFAQNNQTGGGYQWSSQGTAEFENWGATSTGNVIADFMLARATQFYQQSAAIGDFKYYQYSFYVNDQIKATRRLSLTLGIRFDHMGNWVPSDGPGLAVWDPSKYDNTTKAGAWTGLAWNAIDKSVPMSGFPSKAFFPEPRFGAAYDVFGNGKTVLRGGVGLYRYQFSSNSVTGGSFNAPLNLPAMTTNWGCCVGWSNFSDFSQALGTPGLGSGPDGILTKGDERTPKTWTYNFTISQRTPWRSVAELQYSGNRSRDLLLRGPLNNQNLIPVGAFFKPDPKTGVINDPYSSGFPVQDYYPLQNYTGMTLVGHGSYSNYNAVIATWQKQSGPVTFTANYTFSKVLGVRDNQTDNGNGNGTTIWPYSIRSNYGVLNFDHTHIFNVAYIVNMPSPAKHNKFLGGVVNGWVASGITQAQSGAPIQGNTNGNLNINYGCVDHLNADLTTTCAGLSAQNQLGTNMAGIGLVPRIICDPRKNLSSGQYFNPGCFAPPVPGHNGDIIWPYIKGPGFFNSDLAIYKRFAFKEHHRIELRFSAFNFLNHPLPQFNADSLNSDLRLNFSDPGGKLAQTNRNIYTTGKPAYTVGRRVVEFTLKYNF